MFELNKSVVRKDSYCGIIGTSRILQFLSVRVVFTMHQQQDPILTHHNRVCADSAGDIKGPMSDCGENNSPLSLFVPG